MVPKLENCLGSRSSKGAIAPVHDNQPNKVVHEAVAPLLDLRFSTTSTVQMRNSSGGGNVIPEFSAT